MSFGSLAALPLTPGMMRVISPTGRCRQRSHVESLCHRRPPCDRSKRWRERKIERERGRSGDFDRIKEGRGGATVGTQQASNYLPTGALTPWKRSILSRAGLSCLHMACMLSYGQLLTALSLWIGWVKKAMEHDYIPGVFHEPPE